MLEVGKKTVRVSLDQAFAGQADSPFASTLAGLSRGERMDWAIQKATELGANAITPIISERCEVRLKDERDKRLAHWRRALMAARPACAWPRRRRAAVDGSGQEYRGHLLEVGKKTVRVSLDQAFAGQADSPLHIHLGLACPRRADGLGDPESHRTGRQRHHAIISERCEVRLKDERADKRLAHWRQVAISACEQCGRSTLPAINPPITLAEWLSSTQAELKLVLHPVAEPLKPCQARHLAFLIGPEGGLGDAEVEQAQSAGFDRPQSAGFQAARVLRTETAPVVALSVAQQWGDFNQRT